MIKNNYINFGCWNDEKNSKNLPRFSDFARIYSKFGWNVSSLEWFQVKTKFGLKISGKHFYVIFLFKNINVNNLNFIYREKLCQLHMFMILKKLRKFYEMRNTDSIFIEASECFKYLFSLIHWTTNQTYYIFGEKQREKIRGIYENTIWHTKF